MRDVVVSFVIQVAKVSSSISQSFVRVKYLVDAAACPIICTIFCQLFHSDNGVAAAARIFCDLNSNRNNNFPHASSNLIFKSLATTGEPYL